MHGIDRRQMLLGTLALGACGATPRRPDVDALYARARAIDPASRRPIVTIPGFLGSRLTAPDGTHLWGGPDRLSPDPGDPDMARLLALPIGAAGRPLSLIDDGVRTDGVVRKARARLLGGTVEEEVYDGLVATLNAGGYHFSRSRAEETARAGRNPGSLEFPYDWRRDIVEAARDLDTFVERKALQVAAARRALYGWSLPAADLRFDFVAHSMGALVLRYWLMYGAEDLPDDGPLPPPTWAGAGRAACAIFVAPPFLGSIIATDNLLRGRRFGLMQPWYPPAVLGTYPGLYQLMPRDRHNRLKWENGTHVPGSLYEAGTWAEAGWGLLDPAESERLAWLLPGTTGPQARRDRAMTHLDRMLRRAARLHEALDQPARPRGVDLFLVVGTGLDTPASLVLDEAGRTPRSTLMEDGDSVVLRASALHEEAQGRCAGQPPRPRSEYRTVLLLPGEHVGLTRDPVFADNLLYWLLGAPRSG
jgi:hypothetical protein